MPTYDNVCDACSHAFEEWQSFKDDALTKCPKCKKKKLRRLIERRRAIKLAMREAEFERQRRAARRFVSEEEEGITGNVHDLVSEAESLLDNFERI